MQIGARTVLEGGLASVKVTSQGEGPYVVQVVYDPSALRIHSLIPAAEATVQSTPGRIEFQGRGSAQFDVRWESLAAAAPPIQVVARAGEREDTFSLAVTPGVQGSPRVP